MVQRGGGEGTRNKVTMHTYTAVPGKVRSLRKNAVLFEFGQFGQPVAEIFRNFAQSAQPMSHDLFEASGWASSLFYSLWRGLKTP